MAQLKMVNGRTYIDARIDNGNKGNMVNLGDIITVDDPKIVRELKELFFTDRKDNMRRYFKEYTAPVGDDEEDEVEDTREEPVDEAPVDAETSAKGTETRPKARRSRAGK